MELTPIDKTFESLLTKNYATFILTMGFICHIDNGIYKTFGCHAREEYGRSHPLGTCVLLEVPTIQNLRTVHTN